MASILPIDWLLDSDPAIRWQVMRDLTGAAADTVAGERARVASEGWGARLLAARDPDGQWMGGACFPGRGEPPEEGSQPWTSTLPVLMELYDFGLDAASDTARDGRARSITAASTTGRSASSRANERPRSARFPP